MKTPPSAAVGVLLAAALATVSGTAQAQGVHPSLMTAHLARPPAPLQSRLDPGAVDLTRHHAAFDVAYAQAGPARIPGIAKTSVDGRLASDDLTGYLGFLCGLEPGAEKKGAAAARGYDPTGRFVGAKLSLAFK